MLSPGDAAISDAQTPEVEGTVEVGFAYQVGEGDLSKIVWSGKFEPVGNWDFRISFVQTAHTARLAPIVMKAFEDLSANSLKVMTELDNLWDFDESASEPACAANGDSADKGCFDD